MKIHIEQSPYGDSGKTYETTLDLFNHYILQLKSFRSPNKTKEQSDYLEADIKGYEIVVKSNSEDNANLFLKIKNDALTSGKRFKDNLAIIEFMKKTGVWN